MKIIKYVCLIIVILFAIARFNVPDKEKLDAFAAKQNIGDSLRATTDIESHSFYADASIYFSKKNIDPQMKYSVASRTEKYIGAFGTFFKMK